jgi:hypothetical protein
VILIARGPGGENSTQQVYTVAAPVQQTPSIVEQIPILPDLNAQGVRDRLQAIFNNGASQDKRAGVFIIIGGDMAIQAGYLDPFADPGLDNSASGLQGIIDWYNQVDVGNGRSSFDRNSFATGQGWRAQTLNNPDQSDAANCNPGETPLECEIRLLQPAVAIISVGLTDTDATRFQGEMERVLQTLIANGVIPIVSTVQPNPADPATVTAINEALITAIQNVEAASNTSIPIYNLWRAYSQLPNNGLEDDNRTPSTAPGGPGALDSQSVGGFGMNARHHNLLTLLDQLRNLIFPSAAP